MKETSKCLALAFLRVVCFRGSSLSFPSILHLAVAQTHTAALRWSFAIMDKEPVLKTCLNDQNDLGQVCT